MLLQNILFLMCFIYSTCLTNALKLPGPQVFVVTPASQEKGRSAPFYYHNWMRRMDQPKNVTTTTTAKPKTHDLIFAEFGSDNKNSIRNLLEKEKLDGTTTKPIMTTLATPKVIHEVKESHNFDSEVDNASKKNNNYESKYKLPGPIYLPSTTYRPTTTTKQTVTTPKTTSTTNMMDVKNIWHIIDEQNKHNQYSGKWEEHDLSGNSKNKQAEPVDDNKAVNTFDMNNFALPGFNPSPTKPSEYESRSIRTDTTMNFPYVNLKTMQMKRPYMDMPENKKGQNTYANLDNFRDVKYPVRGEAQDVVPEQIDRYNSAIPYFPSDNKNSKQSSKPVKSVGSLVPPPPPKSGSYLPPPNTYESFPPYPPSFSAPSPPAKPPPSFYRPPPQSVYQPPPSIDDSDSPPSDSDSDDGPPSGYQYTPPAFAPTAPPPPSASMSKPFSGYSYEKPPVDDDPPSMPPMDHPKYSYSKPPESDFPNLNFDDDHDHHHDHDHDHHHDHDTGEYPELIYDKPKDSDDAKGGGDMMDMVPPPPPDMKDHGFPSDFPGDFKYPHDDEEFYHDHYHPTTTTTTETPRVNRYSYYYLGKKLYYIPLYFSAYFVAYVASLVIKSVLRHKIVYPNSYKQTDHSVNLFSKRSVRSAETDWDFSSEKLHEVTRVVSNALYNAAEKYMNDKKK